MVSLLIVVSVFHAIRTDYWAADDENWIAFASQNFKTIWITRSPFYHYRPIFGSWLYIMKSIGFSQPIPLAIAGLLLVILSGILGYILSCFWLSPRAAIIATTLFIIHPIRQAHIFWISAQIDSWCLVLSLFSLILGLQLRQKKGRILPIGILLAIVTATACLSKEIAILLPFLVFLLPGPSLAGRRLKAALYCLAGALTSSALTILILNGLGRSRLVISRFNFLRLRHYPGHLIWPTDLSTIRMKALVYKDYFELAVFAVVFSLALLAIGWACIRLRKNKWVWASLILIGSGALVCGFDSDHRGLGLGCMGTALLFAGIGAELDSKLKTAFHLVVLISLFVAWAPCWYQIEKAWAEAKIISRGFYETYCEFRSTFGPTRPLIILGWVSDINSIAWPVDITLTDNYCYTPLMLRSHLPLESMKIEKTGEGRYLFFTHGVTRFIQPCQPFPDLGVVEVNCLLDRYAISIKYDTNQFNFLRHGSGKPVFLYWDGFGVMPLEEKGSEVIPAFLKPPRP